MSHEYPLTFGEASGRWNPVKPWFGKAIAALAEPAMQKYSQSKKAVATYFEQNPLEPPSPVFHDEDAKDFLNTVFEAEQELVDKQPHKEEWLRRAGRHVREFLSDWIVERHFGYLDAQFAKGEAGLREMANQFGLDQYDTPKSLGRFAKKIRIYRDLGSLIHVNELLLSSVKVRTRAGARAERGNLWHVDRREKFAFLEKLADDNRVCPAFTEADLEFLVSQSSMEMLKKKTQLLLDEFGYIEPNRLKANYSRLKEHLQRSKQRESDYQLRRQLLEKLGASPDQIDYISARATYQTMQNLLKMANGKLAISDLMGGKRTIRKLLRRKGQMRSKAEIAIAKHLIEEEGVSKATAENYAKTRKNHSLEHLMKTLDFLKENYSRFYREHWGFRIQPNILRRALEFGLSRQKLSKRTLTKKDFLNDLKRALALEETAAVKKQDRMTPDMRREALRPLREVLEYETDTDTRKQLYFIYEQFCHYGLCISKEKLKQICLGNERLFPTARKVQDALEILNGAYRAIGQHGETLCVLPDYLSIRNQQRQSA